MENAEAQVKQGTIGWTERSLAMCGRFFPKSANTPSKMLEYYSRQFPCVEIDTSHYAMPGDASVTQWAKAAPKGFEFHVKAFQMFTSQRCPTNALPVSVRKALPPELARLPNLALNDLPKSQMDALWDRFNHLLEILHNAGKLGVVLFQYHFKYSEANMAYVTACRERLDPKFTMAAEFRNREWFGAGPDSSCKYKARPGIETRLDWLTQHNIVLVACDELEHELFSRQLEPDQNPVAMPKKMYCTNHKRGIYIRVHRRVGTQRLLGRAELRSLAALTKQCKCPVNILWNTAHEDQPIQNLRSLADILGSAIFDWKGHVRGLKEGITAFFGAGRNTSALTPVKSLQQSPKTNNTNNNTTRTEVSPSQSKTKPTLGTKKMSLKTKQAPIHTPKPKSKRKTSEITIEKDKLEVEKEANKSESVRPSIDENSTSHDKSNGDNFQTLEDEMEIAKKRGDSIQCPICSQVMNPKKMPKHVESCLQASERTLRKKRSNSHTSDTKQFKQKKSKRRHDETPKRTETTSDMAEQKKSLKLQVAGTASCKDKETSKPNIEEENTDAERKAKTEAERRASLGIPPKLPWADEKIESRTKKMKENMKLKALHTESDISFASIVESLPSKPIQEEHQNISQNNSTTINESEPNESMDLLASIEEEPEPESGLTASDPVSHSTNKTTTSNDKNAEPDHSTVEHKKVSVSAPETTITTTTPPAAVTTTTTTIETWTCNVCTFVNDKPDALACDMCMSPRKYYRKTSERLSKSKLGEAKPKTKRKSIAQQQKSPTSVSKRVKGIDTFFTAKT
eukprot:m.40114 g.40114  ORF g.40114 m.40114 type:complete len:797 (+) comp9629_c0_seq1:184-2574(+)